MRIEHGRSGVVVYLRPDPGKDKLVRQQISASSVTYPLAMKIGDAGELIFTKRAYQKLGSNNIEYDQVVKVFAPHAWVYYEFVVLKCDTCRKTPETCGAGYGNDDGCFRYEPVDED